MAVAARRFEADSCFPPPFGGAGA